LPLPVTLKLVKEPHDDRDLHFISALYSSDVIKARVTFT